MGYDGYLHKACARVYDANGLYYVDVDQWLRYPYAEALKTRDAAIAAGRHFWMPPNYKEEDGDLLCNEEAFEGEEGGCRPISLMYPLKPIHFLGMDLHIPKEPEKNLELMYGPTWMIPRPKGYKMVICGWMPTGNLKFALLWATITALPGILYLALPWLWAHLLVCIGRRNVTHKYSNLPTQMSPLHLR
jgi:hypothetical protein